MNSDDIALPRTQSGPRPQRFILNLFADYWPAESSRVPSSGLVRILADFDVTTSSARTALSRLTGRGLITATKSGRSTAYSLSPRGARVLREGAPRLFGFGQHEPEWDGSWLFFAFSVPEENRDLRPALRARLRWAGFAPLFDGLWVSPHRSTDALEAIVEELNIERCAIAQGTTLAEHIAPQTPVNAWDLTPIRDAYDQFVTRFGPLVARTRSGKVTPTEALVARTQVIDAWSEFPAMDPDLPAELLPDDWPRRVARRVFVDVYDGLGMLAEQRLSQLLDEHTSDAVAVPRHHTSAAFSATGSPTV